MPTRRRAARQPDPIDPGPSLTVDGGEPDAYDAVDRLLSEIPEAASSTCIVHVYKFRDTPGGSKLDRCRRVPLAQFDVDKLPELFGGGEFTLRIIDRENNIDRTARVSFDPALFPLPGRHTSQPASVPGAPAPQGTAAAVVSGGIEDRLARLDNALRESQDRHVRFLEQLLLGGVGRPAPAGDQLGQLKALMEIVNQAGRGGTTPAKEIGEAMKMALEFAREAAGAGGGGEGGEGILGQFLDKLGPRLLETILQAGARTPARAMPPAPAGSSPAPTRPALPARPTPAPGAASMYGSAMPIDNPPPNGNQDPALPGEWAQFAFLRKYAGQLLDCARDQTDPKMVGQFTYNRVPEKHLDALETFVCLDPAARAALLTTLDPRLAECTAYVEQVAEVIRGEFEDDTAEDEATSADAISP